MTKQKRNFQHHLNKRKKAIVTIAFIHMFVLTVLFLLLFLEKKFLPCIENAKPQVLSSLFFYFDIAISLVLK